MYHLIFAYTCTVLLIDRAGCFAINKPLSVVDDSNNYTEMTEQEFNQISVGSIEDACVLEVSELSSHTFRRLAHRQDLAFAYLRLKMNHSLNLKGLEDTVDPDLWIWTYHGNKGGYEFLSWPMSFGIWSLGILYAYIDGPIDIDINIVSGDCSSLVIGDSNSDYTVSQALTNLTREIVEKYGGDMAERYDVTYYCHKKKIFIEPDLLYQICRNMFCPIEALEHSCHSFSYNTKTISRHESVFGYNTLWWVGPTVIAIFLFSFSPMMILCLMIKLSEYFQMSDKNDYIYLDGSNYITVAKVLLHPLCKCWHNRHNCYWRFIRCVFPLMSVSIIGVQILLDYHYINDMVLKAVDKCIHMGFRSMLAGFAKSAENYLPIFGGPYIACSMYIVIACVLLVAPKAVSDTLNSGLTDGHSLSEVSPLCLNTMILERYGSVLIKHRQGYGRIYSSLVANFNLCINSEFWKYILHLQRLRWDNVKATLNCECSKILYPFYIFACGLELLLGCLIFGNPILAFGIIVFRSYRLLFRRYTDGRLPKPCIWLSEALLLICIVFFLFMLCIIFLDACRFIARICIFTFTGIVIYPTHAYGYLIFFITVVFYFLEYLNRFAEHYDNLLCLTTNACELIQSTHDSEPLVKTQFGYKGISKKLFSDVINMYSPIRKRILVSFVWLLLIVYILEMAVHLITQRNELRELHTIMHVVTVIFICYFPKLIQSLCCTRDQELDRRREKRNIEVIVKRCLGYFSDDELTEVIGL